jgi:hypothetical protein
VGKEEKATMRMYVEKFSTTIAKPIFFTRKGSVKSGRWWHGFEAQEDNYDCGLEQTQMGWNLHCLFLFF